MQLSGLCICNIRYFYFTTNTAEKVIYEYIRNDYSASIGEAVKQIAKNIEFRKSSYELLIRQIAMNGELSERIVAEYQDFYSQWVTESFIDRSFGMVAHYLPGIMDFRIYHNNETLLEDGGVLWKPSPKRSLSGMSEELWYRDMESSSEMMKWTYVGNKETNEYDLVLTTSINQIPNNNMVGMTYMRIRGNRIFGDALDNALDDQGKIYMIMGETLLYSSNEQQFNGMSIHDTALRDVDISGANGQKIHVINHERQYVFTETILPDWHIVAVVPLTRLEQKGKLISVWIIGITLGLVVFSTMLMSGVINNLVKRLRSLENKIGEVTNGKFDVTVQTMYSDELGDLENRFNSMAQRLGDLMDEIAYARIREREEALNALQAQINPHFLYNTLGIIRWRALDLEDKNLCKLVDSITTFYRLSLNKGNNTIQIKDEIEHLKAYLTIQQFRYNNSVDIIYKIDERVLHYYTIKLILQPIVENCYLHGMVAKNKCGKLEILAEEIENKVVFRISDNGVGMDDELIKNIYSKNRKEKHGYGLVNIIERLKIYFGKQGNLSIESITGKGTTVTISIPVCNTPPEIRREVDENADNNYC